MINRKLSQFEKGEQKKINKIKVEVIRRIAEGSFGEVYLVKDTKEQ